ncbi:helix-turn-helix transcriptional regulator [Rhizohabitans arisaemae]|uniref:helix-turn-helix transcriptional regulator n=1 Tax=Rhizohabitans arisaemae TaxID=2720610 RepID=UPI0024B12B6E|nr:YafY family protein [Rhizohabitans arisaemae]
MSGDTSARLLALLSFLQTPREWPGSELAQRLGVSPRTIRRDIDRLRDLGYPVEATMGAVGGYRLVAGKAMPPLLLDDEEAVAIAVGLRAAAGSPVEGIEDASVRALAKLEQVLPARLRQRVRSVGAATVSVATAEGPGVAPEALVLIAGAVTGRERLRFAYQGWDGARSRRLAEPYRLVASGRLWYLLAFDVDRDDWRIFRVDRIEEPRLTGARFPERDTPEPDAAAFVRRKMYSSMPTPEITVTVHLSAEEVVRRLGANPEEVEVLGPDVCVLRGHPDTVPFSASRLLMLGAEFEVHEPPELVAYIQALGERALRATRGTGGREASEKFTKGSPS